MRILKLWIPRCIFRHPLASELEEWISTKDYSYDEPPMAPKWHIPSDEEVHFANELLNLHLKSALDDLLTMCQSKIHSEPGNTQSYCNTPIPHWGDE
jgi:proteasome activator subunit 4